MLVGQLNASTVAPKFLNLAKTHSNYLPPEKSQTAAAVTHGLSLLISTANSDMSEDTPKF
jgi:hypothetical protein